MSTKFLTNALSVALGGFVVVASQAFAPGPLSWVAFAVAIGIVVAVVAAQLDAARSPAQRGLDAATVVVGGLLVGFSRVLAGSSVIWLAFALSLGIVVIGFIGLALREIANWRAQRGMADLHWLATRPSATHGLSARSGRCRSYRSPGSPRVPSVPWRHSNEERAAGSVGPDGRRGGGSCRRWADGIGRRVRSSPAS